MNEHAMCLAEHVIVYICCCAKCTNTATLRRQVQLGKKLFLECLCFSALSVVQGKWRTELPSHKWDSLPYFSPFSSSTQPFNNWIKFHQFLSNHSNNFYSISVATQHNDLKAHCASVPFAQMGKMKLEKHMLSIKYLYSRNEFKVNAKALGLSLPGPFTNTWFRSNEKCSGLEDRRALGNDAKQEVGYRHQCSKEPLPLLFDSMVSGIWAGR